jgi:hypothetical protein
MVSIDWPQVIGAILIAVSGLGGLVWGGKAAWARFRVAKPAGETQRAADEPAPDGAVEWVSDICQAMGSAPDSSKLAALLAGATRDHARALRITELEAGP